MTPPSSRGPLDCGDEPPEAKLPDFQSQGLKPFRRRRAQGCKKQRLSAGMLLAVAGRDTSTAFISRLGSSYGAYRPFGTSLKFQEAYGLKALSYRGEDPRKAYRASGTLCARPDSLKA